MGVGESKIWVRVRVRVRVRLRVRVRVRLRVRVNSHAQTVPVPFSKCSIPELSRLKLDDFEFRRVFG